MKHLWKVSHAPSLRTTKVSLFSSMILQSKSNTSSIARDACGWGELLVGAEVRAAPWAVTCTTLAADGATCPTAAECLRGPGTAQAPATSPGRESAAAGDLLGAGASPLASCGMLYCTCSRKAEPGTGGNRVLITLGDVSAPAVRASMQAGHLSAPCKASNKLSSMLCVCLESFEEPNLNI